MTSEKPTTRDAAEEMAREAAIALGHCWNAQGDIGAELPGRMAPEMVTGVNELTVRKIAAILRPALEAKDAEIAQWKADHHKLGSWPECPTCLRYYQQDESGAAENARLTQAVADAQHRTTIKHARAEAEESLRVAAEQRAAAAERDLAALRTKLPPFPLVVQAEHCPVMIAPGVDGGPAWLCAGYKGTPHHCGDYVRCAAIAPSAPLRAEP